MNVLVPGWHPWLDVAPKGDLELHPPDPVVIGPDQAGLWYNPSSGVVRARVIDQGTDTATLKLYNEINETALVVLSTDNNLSRRPLPLMSVLWRQRPSWPHRRKLKRRPRHKPRPVLRPKQQPKRKLRPVFAQKPKPAQRPKRGRELKRQPKRKLKRELAPKLVQRRSFERRPRQERQLKRVRELRRPLPRQPSSRRSRGVRTGISGSCFGQERRGENGH